MHYKYNDTSIDFTVVSSNITFTTVDGATFTSIKPIIDTIEFFISMVCSMDKRSPEIKSQNYNLSLSPNPTTGPSTSNFRNNSA